MSSFGLYFKNITIYSYPLTTSYPEYANHHTTNIHTHTHSLVTHLTPDIHTLDIPAIVHQIFIFSFSVPRIFIPWIPDMQALVPRKVQLWIKYNLLVARAGLYQKFAPVLQDQPLKIFVLIASLLLLFL